MLTYLYARLDLTVSALALVEIFKQNGLNLEHVSHDFSEIILNEHSATLYEEAFLNDLEEFVSLSDLEYDLSELKKELYLLLKDIRLALKVHHALSLGRLRAIHLEMPNCVVVELLTPGKDYAPRYCRS